MIRYQYWKSEIKINAEGETAPRWFFSVKAANGEIIAQGETNGYHNKGDLLRTIELLKNGQSVEVIEITK